MKIFKSLAFAMASLLALSCTSTKNTENKENENDNMPEKKILVAYFSATGTTKKVADKIAEVTNATLFEIVPEQPYTSEDLDWRNEKSRTTIEMKEQKDNFRPAIKDKVEDFDQYDIIFVGFPVWWYTCPTIIDTFLESYDFKGKTIIPFATSGGSPIEPCITDMEKAAPGAEFKGAKLLNNATTTQIEEWVKPLLK